jgi:hypothetical protein
MAKAGGVSPGSNAFIGSALLQRISRSDNTLDKTLNILTPTLAIFALSWRISSRSDLKY